MKPLFIFCIVITALTANSSKEKEQEQKMNIVGVWGISDLTYITPEGTQKIMEAEIKNGSAVTDFYFFTDGKYKQTSNMSGSGTLDTYEGTWKLNGNKLIISLLINDQLMDVDYTCELKNELLVLTRTSPDEKMSIVNTFQKK